MALQLLKYMPEFKREAVNFVESSRKKASKKLLYPAFSDTPQNWSKVKFEVTRFSSGLRGET